MVMGSNPILYIFMYNQIILLGELKELLNVKWHIFMKCTA